MRALLTATLLSLALPLTAGAQETIVIEPTAVTDWKAVYGRIEARDTIPARARLGGTLTELLVSDGDMVTAGQLLATIVDPKLNFQLSAIDAQLKALQAQLENAQTELKRGEELLNRGVTTAQRLDALRTQVDVLANQIGAQQAQRQVVEQQAAEGAVLAPLAGRVLSVPVTAGAVVMGGEVVATIGGGGFFLRLAVPERHAVGLTEGAKIRIDMPGGPAEGTLAKVYPQISNGRVVADVEVEGLDSAFVDARVLVRLPLGTHGALILPADAVENRSGLDFVRVKTGDEVLERAVVLGERHMDDGREMVEVVTGLRGGETVVTGHE